MIPTVMRSITQAKKHCGYFDYMTGTLVVNPKTGLPYLLREYVNTVYVLDHNSLISYRF